MATQETERSRISVVALGDFLKRLFLGRGLAHRPGSPEHLSPVRAGRGVLFDFGRTDSGCDSEQRQEVPSRWQQYADRIPEDGRVFVVGSHAPDGRFSSLARFFSLNGLGVDHCDDFEEVLGAVSVTPCRWRLLIVDVDHVERSLDIEDIVNELVEFRERFTEIAVILISHGFATDDSDLIRSAIADHCFRASVGNAAVFCALPHVFQNHQSWIQRRKGLLGMDPAIFPHPSGGAQ